MSEHSTEELKRQMDAATSRKIAAERDEYRARRVYEDRLAGDALAEFAARGILPGTKVIAVNVRWHGDAETRTPATFLGVEVTYGRVRTILSSGSSRIVRVARYGQPRPHQPHRKARP